MIKMYESYRKDGKLPATYEVIYGHAWKKVNKLGSIKVNNQ
jgi:malonyl-CoA O-methyltransferase